mmetsp:Transcript_121606/g.224090  ORF Transcript_121606/g.224090 Transcript_121606/m.224090 type:complete len:387 (-) Transcript_121606:108-1268(-)
MYLQALAANDGTGRPHTGNLAASFRSQIAGCSITSPSQMNALAAQLKDKLPFDIEPQIREMFRRSRARAEHPATPDLMTPTSKASKAEAEPAPRFRPCACGCGAMRYCSTAEDEAGVELAGGRQLEHDAPVPVVDAVAQRAYCERLSRKRSKAEEKNAETCLVKGPARPPDYKRLSELAVPRELPEAPPEEHTWKPLPLPPKHKVSKTQSTPNLAMLAGEGMPAPPPLPFAARAPQSLRPEGFSSLAELRCHVAKANFSAAVSPSSGSFMRDISEPVLARPRRRPTMEMQRRYTEQHLYSKPKALPGSVAALEARLEELRQQNQEAHKEQEREQERRRKREARRAAKRAAAMQDEAPLGWDAEQEYAKSPTRAEMGEPRPSEWALR